EELDGPVQVVLLPPEIRKEAGRDRSQAPAHEEIRVALRRELIGKDAEDPVRHRGVEDVADRDRGAPPRAVGDDRRLGSGAGAVPEGDRDAGGERLLLQARVERPPPAAAPQEVEKRVRRAKRELAAGGIEEEPFAERRVIKARLDAEPRELLEDVAA